MSTRYASIAFTDHVREVQDAYGSGAFYAKHVARGTGHTTGDALSADAAEFLADRDSFYLATVGEGGWPYVQHRGGAAGFVRVLDEHTIGWAELSGNLQYVTTGNLASDGRVALIAVDYPHRSRLKVYGRATSVRADDDPELAARLTVPGHDGVVERLMVVAVEAWDWNCPQHITPRFTLDELGPRIAPMQERLARLEADNERLRGELDALRVAAAGEPQGDPRPPTTSPA